MITYIAELGSCHGHDIKKTKQLIIHLFASGVQVIKFQYWSSSKELAKKRHHPELAEQYETWGTDLDFIATMSEWIDTQGGRVMCSIFLPQDAEIISPYVDCFKIASLENKNQELLKAVSQAGRGLPIYISTGCSTHDELTHLVKLKDGKLDFKPSAPIYLLHCTTAYPAPIDQMHLSVIRNYRLDGLSDHSANNLTGAIAWMCGARHFEFHVRGDWTPDDCPDYGHSLSFRDVDDYIFNIKLAETLYGYPMKTITKQEQGYVGYIQ
jgi:sialic acid synthase SpsE